MSDPLSRWMHLLKNNLISRFSDVVVRSSDPSDIAFSSQRLRDNVNATTGSWPLLRNRVTNDNQTFLSCDEIDCRSNILWQTENKI